MNHFKVMFRFKITNWSIPVKILLAPIYYMKNAQNP